MYEEEEEEEEEPVFVLTDEWMEFFAKSEAKRRLGSRFVLSFHLLLFFLSLEVITHLSLTDTDFLSINQCTDKQQAKKRGSK